MSDKLSSLNFTLAELQKERSEIASNVGDGQELLKDVTEELESFKALTTGLNKKRHGIVSLLSEIFEMGVQNNAEEIAETLNEAVNEFIERDAKRERAKDDG